MEHDDSRIVRVPYEAITRPLAANVQTAGLRDGFASEQHLADLLFRRRVHRSGRGTLLCDGRLFTITEAVRVLATIDGSRDAYGLIGEAEPLDDLLRAGAQVAGDRMRVGRSMYRVERGVIARHRAAALVS